MAVKKMHYEKGVTMIPYVSESSLDNMSGITPVTLLRGKTRELSQHKDGTAAD